MECLRIELVKSFEIHNKGGNMILKQIFGNSTKAIVLALFATGFCATNSVKAKSKHTTKNYRKSNYNKRKQKRDYSETRLLISPITIFVSDSPKHIGGNLEILDDLPKYKNLSILVMSGVPDHKSFSCLKNLNLTILDFITTEKLPLPELNVKKLIKVELGPNFTNLSAMHDTNLDSLTLQIDNNKSLQTIGNNNSVKKLTLLIYKAKEIDLQVLNRFKNIEELTINSAEQVKYQNLSAIGNCQKLKQLVFADHNGINSLNFLKNSKIENLTLQKFAITNVDALNNMPLKALYLYQCGVEDISGLHGLKLESLAISESKVSDLTSLKGMKLKCLTIDNCNVSDLTPLKGMRLKWIKIDNTKISDLTPLKGMSLKFLWAENTKISDLTPLRGAPLSFVNLNNTDVKDLTPLQGCSIQRLELNNTKVSDLTPLRKSKVKNLWLDNTLVSDLSPLKTMTKLKCLRLNNCPITSLEPLKKCPLIELSICYTLIDDLTPLRDKKFEFLTITGTPAAKKPLPKGLKVNCLFYEDL